MTPTIDGTDTAVPTSAPPTSTSSTAQPSTTDMPKRASARKLAPHFWALLTMPDWRFVTFCTSYVNELSVVLTELGKDNVAPSHGSSTNDVPLPSLLHTPLLDCINVADRDHAAERLLKLASTSASVSVAAIAATTREQMSGTNTTEQPSPTLHSHESQKSAVIRCRVANFMQTEARAAIHALTNPAQCAADTEIDQIARLNGLASTLEQWLQAVLFVVPFTETLALVCFYTDPGTFLRERPERILTEKSHDWVERQLTMSGIQYVNQHGVYQGNKASSERSYQSGSRRGSCSPSAEVAPHSTSIFQVIDPDTFDLLLAVPKDNFVNLLGVVEDAETNGRVIGRNFLKARFHPEDLVKLNEVKHMAATHIDLEDNNSIRKCLVSIAHRLRGRSPASPQCTGKATDTQQPTPEMSTPGTTDSCSSGTVYHHVDSEVIVFNNVMLVCSRAHIVDPELYVLDNDVKQANVRCASSVAEAATRKETDQKSVLDKVVAQDFPIQVHKRDDSFVTKADVECETSTAERRQSLHGDDTTKDKDECLPPPTDEAPATATSNRKQCEACGTFDSPEWRKGSSGARSLCNACGLRFARREAKLRKQSISGSSDAMPTAAPSANNAKKSTANTGKSLPFYNRPVGIGYQQQPSHGYAAQTNSGTQPYPIAPRHSSVGPNEDELKMYTGGHVQQQRSGGVGQSSSGAQINGDGGYLPPRTFQRQSPSLWMPVSPHQQQQQQQQEHRMVADHHHPRFYDRGSLPHMPQAGSHPQIEYFEGHDYRDHHHHHSQQQNGPQRTFQQRERPTAYGRSQHPLDWTASEQRFQGVPGQGTPFQRHQSAPLQDEHDVHAQSHQGPHFQGHPHREWSGEPQRRVPLPPWPMPSHPMHVTSSRMSHAPAWSQPQHQHQQQQRAPWIMPPSQRRPEDEAQRGHEANLTERARQQTGQQSSTSGNQQPPANNQR